MATWTNKFELMEDEFITYWVDVQSKKEETYETAVTEVRFTDSWLGEELIPAQT